MRKLHSLEELARIIETHKKEGRRIVLANGCFDLIHAGHVRYLKESKRLGDILVVALNSDSSIRKIKGKGRPILKAKERAEILTAFSAVDYITFFDEPTVDRVLLTLKPHVHAKGSDYTHETVPERETVNGLGGEITIAGGPKIHSTSDLIRRLAGGLSSRSRT
ncbi:MAG: adenylyltransferase/cytidyltransferase family protein [Candidatus Aminicenantales bacterium]